MVENVMGLDCAACKKFLGLGDSITFVKTETEGVLIVHKGKCLEKALKKHILEPKDDEYA